MPTEDQIVWQLVCEVSVKGARLLEPIFDAHEGRNGRLSVQTDRGYIGTPGPLWAAEELVRLAPKIIVKIPVVRAGIPAIEEAHGISMNATFSFTLPQSLAAVEPVERRLKRLESEGRDIATMGSVCTIKSVDSMIC